MDEERKIIQVIPKDYMESLATNNIYKYDNNGRSHYFREDLRTLRDCNRLDLFSELVIEQSTPKARWYIRSRQ